ncbi:hypothetical protein K1719_044849 [Acacia pycnantha]|nr:hypothetical protein K1719_044849 [Acacia pycnantha]
MRRSTRRSLVTPAEVEEPVRNISTRFSLKSYVKRVQLLTNEQRAAITKMGFGSVLLFPNHSLSKNLLAELMERWDCEKQAFIFHLGEISMTLLDVALILGLRVVGHPVHLKDDEPFSNLEEEYGATMSNRKVAVASLESRLDSLGDSVCDDFIRAFLLYTFGTLLFQSSNGKIDSRYLSLFRNLDEVYQFAWGAAVIEDLSKWLDKRKENNVQYVGGCLMFLQTWSYEHFDIGRPGIQEHDLTFPRLCRWHNSKSNQRHWFSSRFKDLQDDQVIWTLQPTSRESEIDIIKEALELQDDSNRLQSEPNCSTSTSISVSDVDSELQHNTSKSHELQKEQEVNFENQIVEDSPTESSTCDRVHREEAYFENQIVKDTPTKLSTCDKVLGEVNVENLIVEDTPTETSTCDEAHREVDSQTEEDSLRKSIYDQVCNEQEVNLENLIVEDTPTELRICDDDLRERPVISEDKYAELKEENSQLREENRLLQKQKQVKLNRHHLKSFTIYDFNLLVLTLRVILMAIRPPHSCYLQRP